MPKFILDVGVGLKVLQYLQAKGFDATSVLTMNESMPDEDILAIANREGRMVVTMDKDFGELVFLSKLAHHGVLLLRLEDANGEEKAEVVRQIMEGFAGQIAGKFCVYKNGRLRIRA